MIYERENSQKHLEGPRLNQALLGARRRGREEEKERGENAWEPRDHVAKMAGSYSKETGGREINLRAYSRSG